jgi:predicted outer membrane protein
MNRSLCRAACSCAVLFGCAALVLAQAQPTQPRPAQPRPGQTIQPAQPGQVIQPGQPGQPGQIGRPGLQGQQLEPSILTLLIIDNNKEIALAKLGQQTSRNEEVKQFCEMIEKDHANFVQKLQERSGPGGRQTQRFGAATGADQGFGAAGRTAATQPRDAATQPDRAQPGQPAQPAQPGQEQRTAATQDRDRPAAGQELRTGADQDRGQIGQRITVARPMIPNQPGSELLQLHQELAEKCLDSARREAEKAGADFDNHFVGAQIVAHKEMLDKLQVFEQHVSPQNRQLLAQAQETTRKHLDHAKQIHEQISKEGGAGSERASERRTESRKDRQ